MCILNEQFSRINLLTSVKKLLETESLPTYAYYFNKWRIELLLIFNSIYIKGSTPISWSSTGVDRERETEREKEREREREKERGGVNSFMAFVFSTC